MWRREVGVTLALLLITLGGFAACDDSGKDKQGGENATSDECTQDCASDHDAEASTGDAGCQESGESTKELLEEIRQICFEACDEHVDCPDFDADRCEYKACGLDLNYLFGEPRGNCWEEGRLCFECYKAATCTELDDEDACAEHCDLVDDLCSSR